MTTEPIQPYQNTAPGQPPAKRGMSLVAILVIVALVLLLVIGVLVGMLLPAVMAVRGAAKRVQTQNNARQVVMAMHNFDSASMRLPSNETDDEGNQLFSWRKQLLPYMRQKNISDSLGRGTSWDDPANKQFIDLSVDFFKSASSDSSAAANVTHLVAVNHPAAPLYAGRTGINSIKNGDGLENTALLLEYISSDIAWAEPRDVSIDKAISIIQGCEDPGGTTVAMSDGSVITVLPEASAEDIKKLFLLGDGAPENLPIGR